MTMRIDRVAERPTPDKWGEDELMSLNEAARLHWPSGKPITERTLRKLVVDGLLPISRLCGKIFVTRRALATLSECTTVRQPRVDEDTDQGHGYLADLAAIDRMGRR